MMDLDIAEEEASDDSRKSNVEEALKLTDAQRERIHRNREKARALRRARVAAKPYDKQSNLDTRTHSPAKGTTSASSNPKPKNLDSHGGFMIEEEEGKDVRNYRFVEEDAPALPDEQMTCEECQRKFAESYLQSKFQLNVCDQCSGRKLWNRKYKCVAPSFSLVCRDPDGKHLLITKTEAKQKFLLKDCDFEERNGPPLPYLLKRNPHRSSWGDMRLYLQCQIQARSYEIWEGRDGLETEHQRRSLAREKKKERKYAKEIKELRRAVRSSMVQPSSTSHEHTFPPDKEIYDPSSDTWTKTCVDCGYQVTFEKM